MTQHFAEIVDAVTAIRHDLHAHPELAFAEHRTAGIVAEQLRAAGLAVTTGIGGTGVVATLTHGRPGTTLGLRADMDALPFQEQGTPRHASTVPGVFHGCGHDGHTAILIGAARHLATLPPFDGTIHFLFQPAEEGQAGARAMIEDGLFDRFPCDHVFALHNWPDLPAGELRTRAGPIMAAADKFAIAIHGRGGHAAMPHGTPDAILAAAQLVTQLNTIVARRIAPTDQAVLSVTQINGGDTHNVLPAAVTLVGTVRSFDPAVQARIEAAIGAMAAGIGIATDTRVELTYTRMYPPTINDPRAATIALDAAAAAGLVHGEAPDPALTAEDFAFMLQACPGAYVWLGQARAEGENPALHHPRYDFNDAIIGPGIAWIAALAERLVGARQG
ncbi:amidohydrolase [Sphingomonas sp. 2R-10]|uniref:amidohydrolase n=1 Tax=Sphingomonas sp. 2R-10 TaxID=3045148 RepID=UPI000F77A61F|nr:amidohydrolase [Sphingomonas sp. 2R-10]MDJ0277042.1 amidohydrolase [Sphingomonas sp. 2R-10]